jgi:histidyl-tRNA synthetase
MAEQFQAPIGTRDVLPPESARWQALIATFADLASRFGYGLEVGPLFEDIGVFQRLGEGTDVVSKEMYDFLDKGERHLALRPEGTASVARAFIQHRPTTPWKVWYLTPAFRYESPQAGRSRQHHQFGVELIGTPDPDADVEVIALGHDYLAALGLRRVRLVINSMGAPGDRKAYVEHLQTWLRGHVADLAADDRDKVESHPMRVLDSKRPETIAVVADAPRIIDHITPEAVAHFERVQAGLKAAHIDFAIEPRLVRGLDYYTHTLFEFQSEAIEAAQSTLVGGGRYDGLVEQLGGPATPGIGLGAGLERALIACDAEGVFAAPASVLDVFVVDVTDGTVARDLVHELRAAGLRADRAFDGRSMKAQMKAADRSTARFALIIGEHELADRVVTLRELRGDAPQATVPRDGVVEQLRSRLEEQT